MARTIRINTINKRKASRAIFSLVIIMTTPVQSFFSVKPLDCITWEIARYSAHIFLWTTETGNRHIKMAEGVGIEPTGDKIFAPRTALKAGIATRRHPLPCSIYEHPLRVAIGVFDR